VVQMNASLVEEATAAATSMASQATGLAHAVAQFKLGDEAQANAAALPAAEAPPGVPPPLRVALPGGGAEEWKEF